ncbi:hypothetical protein D3C77_759750 [compost metagenome]
MEHALAIELHAYACLAGLSIHHQADVGDIVLAQPRVAGAKGTQACIDNGLQRLHTAFDEIQRFDSDLRAFTELPQGLHGGA